MHAFEGLERLEAATFVGRGGLIAKCTDALERAQVIVVRGPAGVGKTRLLREVFSGRGASLVSPDTSSAEAAELAALDRPLVLDGFDDPVQQEAVAAHLLENSPEAHLVLLTRSADSAPMHHLEGPDVVEIEVPPLSAEHVQALAAHAGVRPEVVNRLHAWAEGSPFAVEVAIDALDLNDDWLPGTGPDPPEVFRRLRRRLLPATLSEPHYAALTATALTGRLSIEALAAVVPESDVENVSRWLMSRGLVQSGGSGIEIANRVLRRIVLTDLRHSRPWLEHSLRQRLADHVHSGAMTGRTWLAADLVDLIESPTIRLAWGTGAEDVHSRLAEPADKAAIAPRMRDRGLGEWWELAVPFFSKAPERVTVATDADGDVLGYCIAVTPGNAPEFAHSDPILGPRLDHARRELSSSNAVVFRDSLVFSTAGNTGAVRGAMHLASIMRSDAPNPRYLYIAVDAAQSELDPFLTAVAAQELTELRAPLAERDMRCFLVDLGPNGMLDASRGQILNELGQGPSPFDHRAAPAQEEWREELANLIRNYQRPDLLAASPLGGNGSSAARVESIRARVREAADAAFGESDRETRLREALQRAYFDRAGNHDRAALDMHVSRTTYFRLLRSALTRTVEQLVEQGTFGEQGD